MGRKKMYCHVRRMNGSKATFLCESNASRTFLSPKRLPKGCNVGITQFHEQSPKPCMLYVWCILGIYGPAFQPPSPPGDGHGSAIVLCLPSPLLVWSGCGSVPLPSLWCGGGVVLPPPCGVVGVWYCAYIYNIYIYMYICIYIYICI